MSLVSTVTVGSGGAASIEFTNIPQTGKDLLVLFSGRVDGGAAENVSLYYTINNSSSSIYFERLLRGTGTSAESASRTSQTRFEYIMQNGSPSTASTFSNTQIYITNYTVSNNKTILVDSIMENNGSVGMQDMVGQTWGSTAAITSLLFFRTGVNFVQHSTASLYIIS